MPELKYMTEKEWLDKYHQKYLFTEIPESGKVTIMTGQEWLERYQQELRGKVFNYNGDQDAVVAAVHACDDAARKASGLE